MNRDDTAAHRGAAHPPHRVLTGPVPRTDMKMLMPHVRTVAAALRAYRNAMAGILREPANPLRHRQLDDAAYTLCVLMDRRSAADAAARAESLLAAVSADGAADQAERAQKAVP